MNRPIAEPLVAFICRSVADALEIELDLVGPDDNFVDLGLDSLIAAEVLVEIGDHLDLDLDPTVLADHPSATSLARHLSIEVGEATAPHDATPDD